MHTSTKNHLFDSSNIQPLWEGAVPRKINLTKKLRIHVFKHLYIQDRHTVNNVPSLVKDVVKFNSEQFLIGQKWPRSQDGEKNYRCCLSKKADSVDQVADGN